MLFRFLESMPETRRSWSKEEDNAILELVPKIGTKKWSTVSQAMKQEYGLNGRSGKQCRQRWHNHLNPDVNKREWSKEEQNIVFEAHKKMGNKWTEISKLIEGRTDNAIKNYFYSSIRRSLRRINKYLGSKNSTLKMRHIKPTVLSLIFNFPPDVKDNYPGRNLQEDCKSLTHALIEFSKTKIKSSGREVIDEGEKMKLESLIMQLMIFNQNYEKILYRRKKHQLVQEKVLDGIMVKKEEVSEEKITPSSSYISINREIKKQEMEEEEDVGCLKEQNIQMIMMGDSFNDWSRIEQNCEVEKQIISQNYLSIKSLCQIVVEEEKERVTPSKSESSTIKQSDYLKYQQILECAAFE